MGTARPNRCKRRSLFLLLGVLGWADAAVAQSVLTEKGNIFLVKPSGQRVQLSTSGHDSDPQLSPDKRLVAFVRETPDRTVFGPLDDIPVNEIWVVDLSTKKDRCLVQGHERTAAGLLAGLTSPRFSPDGSRIFFWSESAVTSGAIHAVEVTTGQERTVTGGNSMHVIERGTYRGHLLVQKHKYLQGGGSYDPCCLVTADGKEVRCSEVEVDDCTEWFFGKQGSSTDRTH